MNTSDLMKTDIWRFRNVALGRKLIFDTDWDVTPSNPEKATDGDWDSCTGEGRRTVSAASVYFGTMKIDLGAVYNIALIYRLKITSDGGSSWYIFNGYSLDGSTWTWHSQTTGGAPTLASHRIEFMRTRWVGIRFISTAADTYRVVIYEIAAIPLI
jgi:hypothetical protein